MNSQNYGARIPKGHKLYSRSREWQTASMSELSLLLQPKGEANWHCAHQMSQRTIGKSQTHGRISLSVSTSIVRDTGRWEGESEGHLSGICGSPLGLSLACTPDTAPVAALVRLRRDLATAVALLHTTRPRPSVINGGSASCMSAAPRIGHCSFGASNVSSGFIVAGDSSERWLRTVAGMISFWGVGEVSVSCDKGSRLTVAGLSMNRGSIDDRMTDSFISVSASPPRTSACRPGRLVLNRDKTLLGADAGRTLGGEHSGSARSIGVDWYDRSMTKLSSTSSAEAGGVEDWGFDSVPEDCTASRTAPAALWEDCVATILPASEMAEDSSGLIAFRLEMMFSACQCRMNTDAKSRY